MLGACGGSSGDGAASSTGHCGPTTPTSKPPFAASALSTAVRVTLEDYVFAGLPSSVQGPNVRFDATISGSNCHNIEVDDGSGRSVALLPAFDSGSRTLSAVLPPGTYTLRCTVSEGVKTHEQLGMKATLTVE